MELLQSTLPDIAQKINHPISLIAYTCALIAVYFISRSINDRKKIEANPDAYVRTAERLNIDFTGIPEHERVKVTMRILWNRIISQVIIAIGLIVGGILLANLTTTLVSTGEKAQAASTIKPKYSDSLLTKPMKDEKENEVVVSQSNSVPNSNSKANKKANTVEEVSTQSNTSQKVNNEEILMRLGELENRIAVMRTTNEKIKGMSNSSDKNFSSNAIRAAFVGAKGWYMPIDEQFSEVQLSAIIHWFKVKGIKNQLQDEVMQSVLNRSELESDGIYDYEKTARLIDLLTRYRGYFKY